MALWAQKRAGLNDAIDLTKRYRKARDLHDPSCMGPSLAYVESAPPQTLHSGAIGVGACLAAA